MKTASFDTANAHRFFAAEYFNRVWTFLEKPDRTSAEDEAMLSMAHASLAHWRDREDCQLRNLSIGYWQLSRVYATLRRSENAQRYGELCLAVSATESAFYRGSAHEALARAAQLAEDCTAFAHHLEQARQLAAQVEDVEDRTVLDKDLDSLR